jgi:predicted dehydrogenase
MVRIGIVGVGFMGMIHYLAARRLKGATVSAIATRDPRKRAGDWTMIQGNFGPRGGHEDLSNVATFETAEELIDCADVDLVDICLPNDQHPDSAVRALKAGRHVLVEKAMALRLEDADRMIAAGREAGRLVMVAHVLPFFPDFQFAFDTIRSGRFGSLRAAHFRRHIAPPDWSAAIRDLKKTGGPIIDLHIHDTHFVNLVCGTPKQVSSRGILREGAAEYVSTHYIFDRPSPVVSATCGSLSQPSRPFTHGYEIYLEEATIYYELGGTVKLYTRDGVSEPEIVSADPVDAFGAELACAVDAVRTGVEPALLSGRLARDALALCLKEQESIETGQPVAVV